jgi:xanthine/CO dehydrogenase XdhC/CoxF family maturation factor
MIFGAGHDAIPLAKASLDLGLKTTVVDPRPEYNTAERFPGAERIQPMPRRTGNRSASAGAPMSSS